MKRRPDRQPIIHPHFGIMRRARRRLTRRGRLTLALAVALPLLGLGLSLANADAGVEAATGPVAAARPAARPAPPDAEPSDTTPVAQPERSVAGPPLDARSWAKLPLPAGSFAEAAEPGTPLVLPVARDGQRLEVETTLDLALGHAVQRVLRRARVGMGHVVVMDVQTGAVLAYASRGAERLPPDQPHPAASLVKVVTAAAVLESAPEQADALCRSRGNPWRLSLARLDPRGGERISLRRALATSNNQCFAQLAVHALGAPSLLGAIRRFGLLEAPAPGHAPGRASDPGDDRFALGKLGCGLAGCQITPLHAARLAASLADGRLIEPWWVRSVRDAQGRERALPPRAAPRRVLDRSVAAQLREMLVDTTRRGTARRAFRSRGGPLLQGIRVSGKTGSLSGRNPPGRYEWFIAAAPADQPRVALAVLLVHGDLWHATPAQVGAEVLKTLFCPRGVCRSEAYARFDPALRGGLAQASGG